jgi:hypothetical protein
MQFPARAGVAQRHGENTWHRHLDNVNVFNTRHRHRPAPAGCVVAWITATAVVRSWSAR